MSLRVTVVHSAYSSRQPSGENTVVDTELQVLADAGVDVRPLVVRTDDEEQRRGYPVRAAWRVAAQRSPVPTDALADADLVHVHNTFPNLGRRSLVAAIGDRALVVTLHNYRAVCIDSTLFRDGQVCTDCLDGRPVWGAVHGCYRGSRVASLPPTVAALGGPAEDPLLARADRILTPSARAREVHVAAGIAADRIEVDPHVLPDALIPPAPDPDAPLPADAPWTVVARLDAPKGVLPLLAAWPDHVPLQVIGDGPDRDAARALAHGRPIELVGNLPREAVLARLASSRGLVVPSRWYETFGLVHVEAAVLGRPVVALAGSAIADAVAAAGTGVVIDRIEDVAGGLAAVDDSPAARRHRRAWVERTCGEAAWVERRLATYRDALGQRDGARR